MRASFQLVPPEFNAFQKGWTIDWVIMFDGLLCYVENLNVGVNGKQPVNTATAGLFFIIIFIPKLDIIDYTKNMPQFLVSFVPRIDSATHKPSVLAAPVKRDDFAGWCGRDNEVGRLGN